MTLILGRRGSSHGVRPASMHSFMVSYEDYKLGNRAT